MKTITALNVFFSLLAFISLNSCKDPHSYYSEYSRTRSAAEKLCKTHGWYWSYTFDECTTGPDGTAAPNTNGRSGTTPSNPAGSSLAGIDALNCELDESEINAKNPQLNFKMDLQIQASSLNFYAYEMIFSDSSGKRFATGKQYLLSSYSYYKFSDSDFGTAKLAYPIDANKLADGAYKIEGVQLFCRNCSQAKSDVNFNSGIRCLPGDLNFVVHFQDKPVGSEKPPVPAQQPAPVPSPLPTKDPETTTPKPQPPIVLDPPVSDSAGELTRRGVLELKESTLEDLCLTEDCVKTSSYKLQLLILANGLRELKDPLMSMKIVKVSGDANKEPDLSSLLDLFLYNKDQFAVLNQHLDKMSSKKTVPVTLPNGEVVQKVSFQPTITLDFDDMLPDGLYYIYEMTLKDGKQSYPIKIPAPNDTRYSGKVKLLFKRVK